MVENGRLAYRIALTVLRAWVSRGGTVLRAGERVGNYEIESLLGSGGMASVYRATHASLGSRHAIKMLDAEYALRPEIRDRFLREGRVLAQVRHPGLVRVTDTVDIDGYAGLVMDLLQGEDLAKRLKAGPLSPEVAAGLMLQALSAVGFAHQAGVIHRDLKPANLFLVHRPGKLPLVKVLDFGIAKLEGLDQTRIAQAMGTVAYMSPEQIEDPSSVDARSDLFSLGVVLFEMVAGEVPFAGPTDFAVMQRIVEGQPQPLPERAGVLEPVVRRALQRRPEDRFSDAASFAEVLRGLASVDIRNMVAEWEGEGRGVTPGPASSAPALPPRPASAPSLPPRPAPAPSPARPPIVTPAAGGPVEPPAPRWSPPVVSAPPATAAQTRSLARWAGLLQLISGFINVFFMAVFQFFNAAWCPIFGLPAFFGLLLWGVGLVELVSGFAALVSGSPATLRRTAHLEVLSFAGLGLVSGFVGIYVLSLRRRYPLALP